MKHALRAIALICIGGAVYWLATAQYWDALVYAAVGLAALHIAPAAEGVQRG